MSVGKGARAVAVRTAVCAAVAAAGCSAGGGAAPLEGSAEEIARRAVHVTRAAGSMRVTGRITGGAAAPVGSARFAEFDVRLDGAGGCTGSLAVAGGTAEFVGTGGEFYVKGDERFWRDRVGEGLRADAVQLLEDRWAKAGPQGPGGFCDLDRLLGKMATADFGRAVRKEVTELDGRRAVPLVERTRGGTTTAYVAADGAAPYVLRLESEGGDRPGVMDFTDHGEEIEVAAPDPDEVVDPRAAAEPG